MIIKNLYINQAMAFTQQFQVLSEDKQSFIDLSNKTLLGSMKKSRDSITEIPFTVTVLDPINGIFQIYLDSTQTASLDPSRYYLYDVIIDQSDPVKLVTGNAYIDESITLPSNVPVIPPSIQKFSINGYPSTTVALPDDYVLISKTDGLFKIKVSDLLGL